MRCYVLSVRSRFDAVIAAGDDYARFLTNLTQVNGFRRERDIHSPVKNLSYLKTTHCRNTGEQFERI